MTARPPGTGRSSTRRRTARRCGTGSSPARRARHPKCRRPPSISRATWSWREPGHNRINIIWEVVKYAAGDGAVLWSHTRLGVAGGINLAVAVAIDSAGDPVVTGAVFNGTSSDFLTIKYSGADGTPLWLTSLDDPSNQHASARAVALDAAGDAYVAGEYFDALSIDIRIRKYASSDGAVSWTSQPTTGPLRALLAGDLRGRGMARDAAGNLVVLGTNFNGSSASLRLLKYASADGALMWERAFDIGGNSGDQAVAVAVDPSGGIMVAGIAYDGIFGQFRTLKFGADGSGPLWQKAFTSGFGSGSFVADLAVDAAGNAIVTGSSSAPGSASDFRTIKYAAADGAVLWERSFTSAGSDFDFPWAIALDAQGNVIVAGQGGDGLFGRDYKTIKYAAADGATIWERSFAGVVGGWDSVRAVATDAAGNVIVTGLSDNGFDSDIVTIKYAAADGATLWTRTIAGAAGVGDQPKAVAVDRDGNALVTGYAASAVSPGRRGYLTFKLAAGDGAVLWTASHEGATGSDHSAYALAVDGAGNAIVTGASHNGVVSEFRTIKYKAADGAVAWNHVHNAGAYGVGLAAAALPGAVAVAGNCVADGRPRGICTIRFENKSAATMRLLAAASSVAGQAVTFDASSSAPADPDAPLTGTFTFRDGATVLCTGASTTCTVSNLAPGSHAITVTFEGNALVEAASSAPLTHSVFATPAGIPRLVNIATRLPVLTGDDVLIGGFIIGGTQPKTVVVRARGPSLAASGVSGALANPVLQLFAGATSIAANDDWGTAANAAALQASGYAPANVFESAILTTLGPGAYTAIVTGAGGLTGVGIVEVFEVDRPEVPLVNIATRGRVLTGNDVMIGGFIIQGDAPQTVVIRARGPSLVPFGIANALGDPVLQLFFGRHADRLERQLADGDERGRDPGFGIRAFERERIGHSHHPRAGGLHRDRDGGGEHDGGGDHRGVRAVTRRMAGSRGGIRSTH
ncbi:MAG: Ig-like domain repeat protein [Betaproteobacteria bacterium]|nr:Ig-like domain repeat protein [Betaproteobacteria bacterium]